MTPCEVVCQMQQTGIFGWADIVMWFICAFLCGGAFVWRTLGWLHRAELLAALEIGRRERR